MIKKLVGLILIAAGLAALIIPLVPGIFLIFAGLYLFGGGGYIRQWRDERRSEGPDRVEK